MSKKGAGFLLLGAGAAIGLVWLFRDEIAGWFDKRADIDIDDVKGVPQVVYVTPEVTVKHNGHVRWGVNNRSQRAVVISLRDWQDLNHQPVSAAVDADPDDHDHPPQQGLSREVPAGKNRPIRGRARRPNGDEEKVKYAVYLGDDLAVDPIVKLTP